MQTLTVGATGAAELRPQALQASSNVEQTVVEMFIFIRPHNLWRGPGGKSARKLTAGVGYNFHLWQNLDFSDLA